MRFEVLISEQAETDLRGIFEYIAFELNSVQNAVSQIDRLEEGILSLDQMPDRYKSYENGPWAGRGLRIMVVDNYLVFYVTNQENSTVSILRVFYGGRDIEEQLGQLN